MHPHSLTKAKGLCWCGVSLARNWITIDPVLSLTALIYMPWIRPRHIFLPPCSKCHRFKPYYTKISGLVLSLI